MSVSIACFGIRFSAVLYITNAPSIQMIEQVYDMRFYFVKAKGRTRLRFSSVYFRDNRTNRRSFFSFSSFGGDLLWRRRKDEIAIIVVLSYSGFEDTEEQTACKQNLCDEPLLSQSLQNRSWLKVSSYLSSQDRVYNNIYYQHKTL